MSSGANRSIDVQPYRRYFVFHQQFDCNETGCATREGAQPGVELRCQAAGVKTSMRSLA